MASKPAVFSALTLLGRAFAGTVDEARADVYHAALEDLSDEQLQRAAVIVIKTHTGEFIPPPAVLIKAVAPAPIAVDAETILRRIAQLATYNPASGMIYPGTSLVETRLGVTVAYAYAAAGGPRVFSDDETTQSIARREFQRALVEAVSRPDAALPILDGRSLPAIGDTSVRALIADTAEKLAADDRRQTFQVTH